MTMMLVACRVWDSAEYPPELQRLHEIVAEEAREAGIAMPGVYPGSVEGVCACCETRVAIGPKQQHHLAFFSGAPPAVVCLICATILGGGESVAAGELPPNWHPL